MNLQEARILYGELLGMNEVVATEHSVSPAFVANYLKTVERLEKALDSDLAPFRIDGGTLAEARYNSGEFDPKAVKERLLPLIRRLETGHNLGAQVVEIGSVYNSIRDEELKARCADILGAPAHFDRVVNQATQVLEDRFRKKVGAPASEVGLQLVSNHIQKVKFSDVPAEQDGYASILRGIVGAYRNPSHHKIVTDYKREDALKIVAFVDLLLSALADAVVHAPKK